MGDALAEPEVERLLAIPLVRSVLVGPRMPSDPPAAPQPIVVNADADARFRALAKERGLDPDSEWMGRYVETEWDRARHIFAHDPASVRGKKVLEFGAHVGGTSIILAALGAHVTAIDINADYMLLARANAERYGYEDLIAFHTVPDTTKLPFAGATFDLVSCNSVLEYVPHEDLPTVQREIDRVLRPGGVIAILGTSSRLWPREAHSENLGWNYVPHVFDRFFPGRKIRRGVSPWRLRFGFGEYEDLDVETQGGVIVAMKKRMGMSYSKLKMLELAGMALRPLGMSGGMVTPTVSLILRKRHQGHLSPQ